MKERQKLDPVGIKIQIVAMVAVGIYGSGCRLTGTAINPDLPMEALSEEGENSDEGSEAELEVDVADENIASDVTPPSTPEFIAPNSVTRTTSSSYLVKFESHDDQAVTQYRVKQFYRSQCLGDVKVQSTVNTGEWTVALPVGPSSVQVVAVDSSGNESAAACSSSMTRSGIALVEDIAPYASMQTQGAVMAGGKAYFPATTTSTGMELWVSDGTVAGTRLIKDIRPGLEGSFPGIMNGTSVMKAVGNNVFFMADDGTHGTELWVSDGTEAKGFNFRFRTYH